MAITTSWLAPVSVAAGTRKFAVDALPAAIELFQPDVRAKKT